MARILRWLPAHFLGMAVGAVVPIFMLGRMDASFAALWWVGTMVVIRSDLERYIIPDEASAAIAGLGLLHALSAAVLEGASWQATVETSGACLAGGSLAFATFWLVARLHRLSTGRDGLGFGDVKLAGACGLWLGLEDQVITLEIAAVAAIAMLLLFRRGRSARQVAIPFGAFLAPAAWLVFVMGPGVHRFVDAYV